MKLVFTSQELEPFPKHYEGPVNKPLGFLTSEYKQIVKRNFNNINSPSLFGVRQRIKRLQYRTNSGIETILKVSLFLIVFLAVVV